MQASMEQKSQMDIQQVIARWDEEECAVRARLIDAGIGRQDQIAARSGMPGGAIRPPILIEAAICQEVKK